jgi:hypothetical protein
LRIGFGASEKIGSEMADEVRDTAAIVHVFHVDEAKDEAGQTSRAGSGSSFENGMTIRLPIYAEAAARLSALLALVCERHGWPIREDKMQ